MKKCKHTNVKETGPFGYTRSVAVHPLTHENRAAHGGVCFVEECQDCGKTRRTNTNGRHQEVGPWRKA
jgi:hypothetical protein